MKLIVTGIVRTKQIAQFLGLQLDCVLMFSWPLEKVFAQHEQTPDLNNDL